MCLCMQYTLVSDVTSSMCNWGVLGADCIDSNLRYVYIDIIRNFVVNIFIHWWKSKGYKLVTEAELVISYGWGRILLKVGKWNSKVEGFNKWKDQNMSNNFLLFFINIRSTFGLKMLLLLFVQCLKRLELIICW